MLTTVHAFMYFTLLAALDTSAHRFGEGRVTPERTEGWHTYSDSGLSLSQTDHDQHQEVESFCNTDILPTFTVSSHLFPGCPFSFALPTWHQFVCGWVGGCNDGLYVLDSMCLWYLHIFCISCKCYDLFCIAP